MGSHVDLFSRRQVEQPKGVPALEKRAKVPALRVGVRDCKQVVAITLPVDHHSNPLALALVTKVRQVAAGLTRRSRAYAHTPACCSHTHNLSVS